LISDYNREESRATEYSGRVLLELIQNANDAGTEYTDRVDIHIELTEDHLLIANTGNPFGEDGMESLLISDNSPKQFRADAIGYKGLGFRSILNWTSSVLILSGELSVAFDDQIAADFLTELRAESSEIDEEVREFEANGISTPIATLSVPYWLDQATVEQRNLGAAHERCQQLQEDGFETVICVPIDDSTIVDEVQAEINRLSEDVTLFLEQTRSLEIQSPERTVQWEIERSGETVEIQTGDGQPQTWNIIPEKGKIPERYQGPDQTKDQYEIKIATPMTGVDKSLVSKTLSVFFPTEVAFPFPILAHATFEVTDNRNHLVESEVNEFVADRLATLMARTAESIKQDQEHPWLAFSTVSPDGPIDDTLNRLSTDGPETTFEDVLREALSKSEIVPVYGGGFGSPNTLSRIDGDFEGLLDFETFSDVCRYPGEQRLRTALSEMGVPELPYEELRSKLNEITDQLSTEDRAAIIYQLVTNDLITDEPTPTLLIDSNSEPITPEERVFLPPQSDQTLLPEWISQNFLDSDLTAHLEEKFAASTNRELTRMLKPFDVNEYDVNRLIQSTVAEANERVRDAPDQELQWRQKMISVLWMLRSTRDGEFTPPSDLTVQLPNRTGGTRPAEELYLGNEYPDGQLLEELYQPVDPGMLVATPDTLGLSEEPADVQDFLCWIGVANRPRVIERDDPTAGYKEYILEELDYPLEFGDLRFETADDLPSSSHRKRLKGLSTIDRLEDILEHADPHAILCMLSDMGDHFELWQRQGDTDAEFEVKPKRRQNWRQLDHQILPAYPTWLIRTTSWLPVEDGERTPPELCSLSQDARSLSPAIGYPAVDMNHRLFDEFGMDRSSVKIALQRAGVAATLEDLSWDSFYQVLLKLPEIDPDGEYAQRMYSLILSKDGSPSGEKYNEFRTSGKMLGSKDNETSYYPVDELRFPESRALPTVVIDQYPIVNLQTQESPARVKKRFGVEPLSIDNLQLSSLEHVPHHLSDGFETEVEHLERFVYALRMDTTRERQARRAIEEFDILLCDSFEAIAKVGGEEISIELEAGSFLIWESTAYLVPDTLDVERSPVHDENVAGLLGEVFSTILEVDVQKEVYILATASDRMKVFPIISGKSKDTISEAWDRFQAEDSAEFPTPVIEEERHSPESPPEDTSDISSNGDSETNEPITPRPQRIDNETEVETEQRDLDTIDKRNISTRRVQRNSASPTTRGRRQVADGDRAEDLCLKFEENQGRYPIKVAGIQGSESYRCDIISFESEDRKQEFLNSYEAQLIDRYIEVKASTTRKSSITLKGNQLTAAQDYRERYFLYRAYESTDDASEYEIVVLNDPIRHEDAITRTLDINPFYTEASDCYQLDIQIDSQST
jgi:hypothetical protein